MLRPPRLGLFGGSFDPIHSGHLGLARAAVAQAGLDQIMFLPARRSPHKAQGPIASDAQRLAMLHLAVTGFPEAVVSDFELQAPPPSYSWETALHFQDLRKGAQLYWLLGLDQWNALDRWRHPERLAETVEFLVFARDGQEMASHPYPHQRLTGTFPFSSTQIREALAQGDPAPPDSLPPAVKDFIEKQQLYRQRL
ncbi:MAG: nicotinate (nicotinamide) nucleotide adenylyltransferase [Verrucomicrobiota bacterium]